MVLFQHDVAIIKIPNISNLLLVKAPAYHSFGLEEICRENKPTTTHFCVLHFGLEVQHLLIAMPHLCDVAVELATPADKAR